MLKAEECLDESYKNATQQYVQVEHNHLCPTEKMELVQQRNYWPEKRATHLVSTL
jgi:predicted lipoprotein